MRALSVHRGLVVTLDRANVDTDAIIPKQFLKSILLNEGNFGHGFEDVERKPLSKYAGTKNIVGRVLADQHIPIKSEIVTALENIIGKVS